MSSDVTQIAQLVLRERQGRDRGWWDQMRSCFAEDATVRLSWFRGSGPGFVAESRKMAERGDTAVHRLSPPVVHCRGDRALVELPAVIEMRTDLDGTEVDLASTARLCYRIERRDGGWLVLSLDPVYERDSLTSAHPGVPLAVGPQEVAVYRPSYRFLSHVLSRRGYAIGDDLYGDDRPDQADRFYRDAHAWLDA
ncbi:nuclear transport factor 2 family protein [Amycolatopsis sp. PS_44_ISF1]|uniref:nuclear transport factor 2 family protein n=1 Tax=Amycolatopsis sp. PS_44_ISF1 TaxID=2974917 RepID=UPI0028DDE773|nr:nuclear transport factor 2 family protein [Amycolatopsis sp. PS_44_ISF1]MDT8911388.1 nuclear transport factor 2 family protein [Amycolatopsis sp. PS_44_ISF1]